jgi:hypothetical protein
MFGRARFHVLRAASISIHGDIYFDTTVTPAPAPGSSNADDPAADPPPPVTIRLPSHLCDRPPQPGDTLELGFLMGQVNHLAFI